MMNDPKTSCIQCERTIELDVLGSPVTCECSLVLCTSCGHQFHSGFTCFYNLSTQDYQVIDLSQPIYSEILTPLLNSELAKVRDYFNISKGNHSFSKAFLIINKPLEQRYLAKKKTLIDQCGGINKINEILMWHGSLAANYEPIMRDGLKVGGVDGIPIRHGTGYGYGIYSTKSFQSAASCANDSKKAILFQGLLGNNSASTITDPNLLNNGLTHSYTTGEVSVFFTKEQVIPKYLVESA